jgi:hypothetical protein
VYSTDGVGLWVYKIKCLNQENKGGGGRQESAIFENVFVFFSDFLGHKIVMHFFNKTLNEKIWKMLARELIRIKKAMK